MLWNLFYVLWSLANVVKLLAKKYYNKLKPHIDKWYQKLVNFCCPPKDVWMPPNIEVDPNTTLHLNWQDN